jgi:hypothetical protein
VGQRRVSTLFQRASARCRTSRCQQVLTDGLPLSLAEVASERSVVRILADVPVTGRCRRRGIWQYPRNWDPAPAVRPKRFCHTWVTNGVSVGWLPSRGSVVRFTRPETTQRRCVCSSSIVPVTLLIATNDGVLRHVSKFRSKRAGTVVAATVREVKTVYTSRERSAPRIWPRTSAPAEGRSAKVTSASQSHMVATGCVRARIGHRNRPMDWPKGQFISTAIEQGAGERRRTKLLHSPRMVDSSRRP